MKVLRYYLQVRMNQAELLYFHAKLQDAARKCSANSELSWKYFEIIYDKNVKIVIIEAFKSKFYKYFVFTKKNTPPICLILHQFNFYVLLICGKKIGDD